MKPPQSATGVKTVLKDRSGPGSSHTTLYPHLQPILLGAGEPSSLNPQPSLMGGRVNAPSSSWSSTAGKESTTLVPLCKVCLTFTAGQGPAPLEVRLTLQGLSVT